MWRIFVPLKYLRIKHKDKWKFDFLLPVILCALFSWPLLLEGFRRDALTGFDLIGKATGFVGTLAGFYVAALAAVATFGRPEMDEPMIGPVQLHHFRGAESHIEDLSRRRFLSFLFGYMALIALLLGLVGAIFSVADKYFIAQYTNARPWIFSGFWIVYAFAVGNILSNSLLGLFYLTDRMHRPNPGVGWRIQPGAAK